MYFLPSGHCVVLIVCLVSAEIAMELDKEIGNIFEPEKNESYNCFCFM